MISQCATTLPWVGAWAPNVSGCQNTQPEQKKAPVAAIGPFGDNPTKIARFSSAAKFTTLYCGGPLEAIADLGRFLTFFAGLPRFSKKKRFFLQRSHQIAFFTVVGHKAIAELWRFLALLCWLAAFQHTKRFLVAQPPNRPYDRPVRWHLGYWRARDAPKPRY